MRSFLLSVVVASTLLGVAADVCAQTPRPDRPNRGLFGQGFDTVTNDQLLTVTSTLGFGYDGNVLANGTQSSPSAPGRFSGVASTIGQGTMAVKYALSTTRIQLNAGLDGSVTYYPQFQTDPLTSRRGNIDGTLQITPRLQVSGSQTASSQPLYLLFAGALPPVFDPASGQSGAVGQAPGTIVEDHLTFASNVQVSEQLSRTISLSGRYGVTRSESPSGLRDLRTRHAGGRLTIALSKGLSLRLGYSELVATFGAGDTVSQSRRRNIDVGLALNRALSLTRRTTLTYGSGLVGVADVNRTRYHLTGNALLTREIRRTWQATVAYDRGVSYVDTFRAPVFSDALNVGASGMFTRRLKSQSSLGGAKGQVGTGQLNGFTTTYGTTGLTFGLTRMLAAGIDYSYYRYFFDSGVSLPSSLPRRTDRQSVRVFVTLLTPIFHHTRRPDASR